jgi:hypothetical protein
MKGFVNTVLGEPYEEEFEAPEWERLYERREPYVIGIVWVVKLSLRRHPKLLEDNFAPSHKRLAWHNRNQHT